MITFDQFKSSVLNKSINFYNFFPKKKKKLYWLQAFEWYNAEVFNPAPGDPLSWKV